MPAHPHEDGHGRPKVRLTYRRLAIRDGPARQRKPYVIRAITTGWIGQRPLRNRRMQVGFSRDWFRPHPIGADLATLAERSPGVWIAIPRSLSRATTLLH